MVSAEAEMVSAEAEMVSAEAEMVSAEAEMVSAEAEMVSTEAEMVKSIANAARLKQKLTKEQVAFIESRLNGLLGGGWDSRPVQLVPPAELNLPLPEEPPGIPETDLAEPVPQETKGRPFALRDRTRKPPTHPKTPRPKTSRGGQTARSNQNGRSYRYEGVFSPVLSEAERELVEKMRHSAFQDDIAIFRVILLRLLSKAAEINSLDEMIEFINSYGLSLNRLAKILEGLEVHTSQKEIINQEIAQAAERILEERRGEEY